MIPDKYKVILTMRYGTREIKPGNIDKLRQQYAEPDDNKLRLQIAMSGKLTLSDADFHWIYQLERTSYRCEPVEVRIDKRCGTEYIQGWQYAEIYLSEGNWNLDQCKVELSVKVKNEYLCYDKNKNTEFDVMALIFQRYTMKVISGTIETVLANQAQEGNDTPPEGEGWVKYFEHLKIDEMGFITEWEIRWARLNKDGVYSQPSIIVTEFRESGIRNSFQYNGYELNYTAIVVGQNYSDIDNGMKLKDVLEKALNFICPGLTVKSDFFQINPEVESDINYVTGATSLVKNLMLFQKSDVKRPNADNNATRQMMEVEKFIENISNIFNLRHDIIDNVFILEHVSFFDNLPINDLTIDRYKEHLQGKRKYAYAKEKLPHKEIFKMMEQQTPDFVGMDILYKSGCETVDKKATKTIEADFITTDFNLVVANPLPDNDPDYANKVTDKGFFLAALDANNELIWLPGKIDNISTPNNSLSWAWLHELYWKHKRPQKRGIMNGVLTQFHSVILSKVGEKFTIPYCCGDDFEMDGFFKTPLGTGKINSAEFNLLNESLDLTIAYDPEEGMLYDEPPVANPDEETMLRNGTLELDILANDTDVGNNIDRSTIEIISQLNCTVTKLANGNVSIQPTNNFVGAANFVYRVRDTNFNWSNTTIVKINVLQNEWDAWAVDDFYSVRKNEVLHVPASQGVLANDLGVPPLTCTLVSPRGNHNHSSIVLNSDGSFTFTPDPGYQGTDYFLYELFAGNGANFAGTVEVTIFSELYARLKTTNEITSDVMQICSGSNKKVGTNYKHDVKVVFYSDAAGTIPYNATNVDINVKIVHSDFEVGGSTEFKTYNDKNGHSIIIEPQFLYKKIVKGCNNEVNLQSDHILTLEPSSNYIIIP